MINIQVYSAPLTNRSLFCHSNPVHLCCIFSSSSLSTRLLSDYFPTLLYSFIIHTHTYAMCIIQFCLVFELYLKSLLRLFFCSILFLRFFHVNMYNNFSLRNQRSLNNFCRTDECKLLFSGFHLTSLISPDAEHVC